jgi:hypothetical protein
MKSLRENKNKYRKPSIYTGIAKVQEIKGDPFRFVKYRFNKPERFIEWLQRYYSSVAFINLYSNVGSAKGSQVGHYTQKSGLVLY